MTYQITSATTKPTRRFIISHAAYNYSSIKQSLYTGYSLITVDNKSFLIADPEKALTDYLYFYSLSKKSYYDRLTIKNINKRKLLNYAKLYQRKKIFMAIKKIYAHD